jgi:GTPase SAR1 family protein
MTRIVVLGDSGVGTTSWLHTMQGGVPCDVYRSSASECYLFRGTVPAVTFIGVPGDISERRFVRSCESCDGAVILYVPECSSALRWLRRLVRTYGPLSIPVLVCAHQVDTYEAQVPGWLEHYPTVEFTSTTIRRPVGILDCANRIITRARRTLASPLGFGE